MGLPPPLGPYAVAFVDFELRRAEPPLHGAGAQNAAHATVAAARQSTPGAPLMRIFYPTSPSSGAPAKCSSRSRWLPGIMYTWGYLSKLIPPSSCLRRVSIWILAAIIHSLVCCGAVVPATVGGPLLSPEEDSKKSRFPVVVFSHGLWACRSTYSALCCDLASHGYIVVAPEHLDGSANMASYADQYGKRRWAHNSFAEVPVEKITIEDRSKQLQQRVLEVQKVVDVLEKINGGLLTQNANTVCGKAALIVSMLQGQMDLHYIAIAGHSFGAATAIIAAGVDKRLKCCLAMDAWWEPIEKVEYSRLAGKVPVLLLNTQKFDWKALHEARMMFLNARAEATSDGRPLITELMTIKDTSHQDQSDFTMLFPYMMKKLGVAGTLDPVLTKNINNRACLQFLHKQMLPPGTGAPYAVDAVEEDADHLIIGTLTGT